jgi:hypothetical protein
MNLDEIKSMWDNEPSSQPELNEVPQLTQAKGPLDRIRRNMRNELYAQIVSLVLLGMFPFYFEIREELIPPYFILCAVVIAIVFYYMLKYYFFYKRLSNTTLSSKEHLYTLYFEIRLNMEMYKAFSYSLVPFMLIFVGMIVVSQKWGMSVSSKEMYLLVGLYIVMMIVMALATTAWVNVFYGKYAKQIKRLLDEIIEP